MSRFGSEGEDIIGRWSEEKLELLTKYLKAYSDIMNKQKQEWLRAYYYIDAFAGSVQPKAKDEERYIDGSPLRALRTQPRFDGYWFIDVSQQRIERLERLREEFNYYSIRIRQGDCNEILRNEVIPQITWSSKQRATSRLSIITLRVGSQELIQIQVSEFAPCVAHIRKMVEFLQVSDSSREERRISQLISRSLNALSERGRRTLLSLD